MMMFRTAFGPDVLLFNRFCGAFLLKFSACTWYWMNFFSYQLQKPIYASIGFSDWVFSGNQVLVQFFGIFAALKHMGKRSVTGILK